jgi:branched-subunit amino acid ABC-type transport system permease component
MVDCGCDVRRFSIERRGLEARRAMIDLMVFGLIWGVSVSFTAVALGTTWRILGMLDFGLAGVYAVVGYTLVLLHVVLKAPLWLAIVAALTLGPICQVGFYRFVYAHFLRTKKPLAVLVLLGLAVLYVCENIIALSFGSAGQLVLTSAPPRIDIGTISLSIIDVLSPLILIAIAIAMQLLFRFTGVGLALRAAASNPDLAQVFGVNLEHVRMAIFGLSGFLVAIPALLTAVFDPITPTAGFNPLLFGFAALVIASVKVGVGVGPHMLAGLGLGLLTGMSLLVIPSQWQLAVPFVTMLLVSVVRRQRTVQRSV